MHDRYYYTALFLPLSAHGIIELDLPFVIAVKAESRISNIFDNNVLHMYMLPKLDLVYQRVQHMQMFQYLSFYHSTFIENGKLPEGF